MIIIIIMYLFYHKRKFQVDCTHASECNIKSYLCK